LGLQGIGQPKKKEIGGRSECSATSIYTGLNQKADRKRYAVRLNEHRFKWGQNDLQRVNPPKELWTNMDCPWVLYLAARKKKKKKHEKVKKKKIAIGKESLSNRRMKGKYAVKQLR